MSYKCPTAALLSILRLSHILQYAPSPSISVPCIWTLLRHLAVSWLNICSGTARLSVFLIKCYYCLLLISNLLCRLNVATTKSPHPLGDLGGLLNVVTHESPPLGGWGARLTQHYLSPRNRQSLSGFTTLLHQV